MIVHRFISSRMKEQLVQKEFVSKNKLVNVNSLVENEIPLRLGIEIIKTTELIHTSSYRNSIHWIYEKLWINIMSNILDKYTINRNIKYMYAFLPFDINRQYIKNSNNCFGMSGKDIVDVNQKAIKLGYTTADEMINLAKKNILDSNKYRIKSYTYSNEDYLFLFRYIMLSLSGKIDPRTNNNPWSELFLIEREKIDYDSTYLNYLPDAQKEFNQVVATCIFNFCSDLNILNNREHELVRLMNC